MADLNNNNNNINNINNPNPNPNANPKDKSHEQSNWPDRQTTMEEPSWVYDTEYLVLSGGGVMGFAYTGAILVLDDAFRRTGRNLYAQLKGISGASIGACYALFIVLGIRGQQLFREVMNTDVSRLADCLSIDNLLEMYGLNSKIYMQQRLFDLIEKYTGNGHITFQELHNMTSKHFVCSVSNVNKGQVEYHSYLTTPHYKVIDSVCASMSIPFLFAPTIINNDLYVDGGVMDNLPFSVFPPENTFMINLSASFPDCSSLTNYMRRILLMCTHNIDDVIVRSLAPNHRKHRLVIRLGDGTTLNFRMEEKEKRSVIESGAQVMTRFLYPRTLVAECMKILASALYIITSIENGESDSPVKVD